MPNTRKKYRNEVQAGLFVIFSGVLFFVTLALMGSFRSLTEPYRTVHVEFEDVKGLRSGDPVYLLGQKVGIVEGLKFRKKDNGAPRVIAALSLPAEDWKYLTQQCSVFIDKSITGNLSVEIQDLHGPELTEGFLLKGTVTFDMVKTADKIEIALVSINDVIHKLAQLLESVEKDGQIEKMLANLSKTIHAIAERSGPLMAKVDNIASLVEGILGENRDSIHEVVTNVSRASKVVNRFLEKLTPAVDTLDDALKQLAEVSRGVDDLIVRNAGHIDGILEDLRETSANALTLTDEVKRRPWKLLFRPSENELETFDLYDAAWAYNLAAKALNRSVRDLAALSRTERSDEAQVQDVLKAIEASLKRQKEAEESFYSALRDQARG
jgi:hypothetical protein